MNFTTWSLKMRRISESYRGAKRRIAATFKVIDPFAKEIVGAIAFFGALGAMFFFPVIPGMGLCCLAVLFNNGAARQSLRVRVLVRVGYLILLTYTLGIAFHIFPQLLTSLRWILVSQALGFGLYAKLVRWDHPPKAPQMLAML